MSKVTFRNIKGGPLTFSEMDTNLSLYYTSSSIDGTEIKFFKSGSNGATIESSINLNLTTDDISEGSNLYYTDGRVKAKLNLEEVISQSSQVDITQTQGYSNLVDLTSTQTITGDKTFDGTINVQTQTTTDDSNKAASTEFVQDRIAEVIDLAPAALDTLNELAAALGDDPNISSSLATTISTKLSKSENLADLNNSTTAVSNLGLDTDLQTFNIPPSTTISTFGASLVDDVDAASARTTLGLAIGTNVNGIIGTDTDLDTSGAEVVDQINVTDGVIQTMSKRTLTLGDLGYTGATDANNYTHPTHPGDDFSVDSGALTGATVISDIDINVTTDTLGHVTDANGTVATRTLTLNDLGYSTPNLQAVTTAGASTTDSITAANFITTSDRRLKSDIIEIKRPFSVLDRIKPYEYIKDGQKEGGFIAQEVQKVLPYAVFENEDGMLTMSDRSIVAHLLSAVKELKQEVELLSSELERLKN